MAVEDIVVSATIFCKSICSIQRDKCYTGEQTMNGEFWITRSAMENWKTINMVMCKTELYVRKNW